jgi:hypothetical protein
MFIVLEALGAVALLAGLVTAVVQIATAVHSLRQKKRL